MISCWSLKTLIMHSTINYNTIIETLKKSNYTSHNQFIVGCILQKLPDVILDANLFVPTILILSMAPTKNYLGSNLHKNIGTKNLIFPVIEKLYNNHL